MARKIDFVDRNVSLFLRRFHISDVPSDNVMLWNVAPKWPPRKPMEFAETCEEMVSKSGPLAHLVLWMPCEHLHEPVFEPTTMMDPWLCQGTILSGSDPLHIGYVYSRSHSRVDWGSNLILDERKKRGPNSSRTVEFMLEKLLAPGDTVVDPFAHGSAVLPIWSRRKGLRYIGYTSSAAKHKEIVKALAQIELPGIQMALPT